MLEHGVRISVCCMHIFCMHIGKAIPRFMLFIIIIKNQIKSLTFVNARFYVYHKTVSSFCWRS
jgi:hypothetical protein